MDRIKEIKAYAVCIPRDVPYLGPLGAGETPDRNGNFVRKGNRAVYSVHDQSVVVRVTSESGVTGWGESYAIINPESTASILNGLLAPMVEGRDPLDVMQVYEDLYDAMRVRGFWGGHYLDAIAGLDIALWDLKGRLLGQPIHKLLGGASRREIPAYVSGLPKSTLGERVALAKEWQAQGFSVFKFAAAVADQGEVAEMRALREGLGPDARIAADLHWRYTVHEAASLIRRLNAHDLFFAEAPLEPENLEGMAQLARQVETPIALGEEWHTPFEYRDHFERRCMSIVQPEIAHMGVTGFWIVCQLARLFHCRVFPHASIGIGVFQAASLQVCAASSSVVMHEYQHSVFDRNLRWITGGMRCSEGAYVVPDGPGLGVQPRDGILDRIIRA